GGCGGLPRLRSLVKNVIELVFFVVASGVILLPTSTLLSPSAVGESGIRRGWSCSCACGTHVYGFLSGNSKYTVVIKYRHPVRPTSLRTTNDFCPCCFFVLYGLLSTVSLHRAQSIPC
ncbi:unnamed protein product, partial [Discosporangium mesarthrocarpum]